MDLPLLSALFIAFALALYVMLDGFDLGVGALLLLEPDEAVRDRMVDSITPTWDGNETWLIMAGVGLLAAFPIAYGILLPAFYLPLITMLLALGLRGVSFEFRVQSKQARHGWDIAFGIGSIIAALMQGLIVGGLIQGVATRNEVFEGSVFDVLSLYCLLMGLCVLAGYVTLGAAWLRLKGEGALHVFAGKALRSAIPACVILAVFGVVTSSLVQPGMRAAWGNHPIGLMLICVLFVIAALLAIHALKGQSDQMPFAYTLAMFVLGIAGLGLAIFPNVVPFRLSLWEAASASQSQAFLLFGAAVVTPVILAYNAFAYRVFGGKTPAEGWEA